MEYHGRKGIKMSAWLLIVIGWGGLRAGDCRGPGSVSGRGEATRVRT